MKRILVLTLLLVMIVFCTSAAWGAVVGLGARAVGMGGAYTAVADDEYAPYWNPAGITYTKHMNFPSGFGFQGDFNKLVDIADKVSNKEMPSKDDLNQAYYMNGYLGLDTKYFGLSGYTDSQLSNEIDSNNKITANISSDNYGILSIAGKINENLTIGVNLKAVAAASGRVELPPVPTQPTDPLSPEWPDYLQKVAQFNQKGATVSYQTGTGEACDLGVLYKLTPEINLGLMARNVINQVSVDQGNTITYQVNPITGKLIQTPGEDLWNHTIEMAKSYVLGVAYHPSEATLVAADLETITNSGNDDQTRIHVGIEQKMLWNSTAVRLGCFTNKGDPTGFTAGLGLKLWIFNSNLAIVTGNGTGYFLSGNVKF